MAARFPPSFSSPSPSSSSADSSSNEDEPSICHRCDGLQAEILRLREENDRMALILEHQEEMQKEISKIYAVSPWGLALRRLPALALTLALELLGGLVIAQLHKVIRVYTLIVSFMPAISALSGNLGLQASANTIRGLGTGHIPETAYASNVLKEVKSGLVAATLAAAVMATVGASWCFLDPDSEQINKSDPEHPFVFGFVLFLGTWLSMMISTVNGAGTPVLAQLARIDPAKIAGPLETAFQDVVGQSFLLGLCYAIFHATEDRL